MLPRRQPLLVQKYGGSSLSSLDHVRAVARKVIASRDAGQRVVAVVSAMGDTTSQLVERARAISDDPPARELDVLLSAGERMSMALLSMAIQELGVEAVSLTGPQAGILTDELHTNARIERVRPERVRAELDAERVVIIAGFQGLSLEGEVTTLGRGGSDTTAVALAAALDADACEIYSDVPGILTADPRDVPGACHVRRVDTAWMAEYSRTGARVLHAPCVELAERERVLLRAASTFEDTRVTAIAAGAGVEYSDGEPAGVPVLGVTSLEHCLRVHCARDAGPALLEALPEWTYLGSDGPAERLDRQDLFVGGCDEEVGAALAEIDGRQLPGRLELETGLASVSVVTDAEADPGLSRRVDLALERAGVSIQARCLRPLSVTRAVRPEQRQLAVRSLHRALVERVPAPAVTPAVLQTA